MEDGSKASQAFGGQQRTQHPRPFFYVQPPSQPYYLYQPWQLNSPYSHYGLPAGFNYARPCMPPYQPYMQYPGLVFPQGPVYPVDYRRMFDPRFQSWNEAPRQQSHARRETASSEAQTDPNEAITKLIERLDKMQSDGAQAPQRDRELDSGVASQSSAIFSPEDERKGKERSPELSESRLESPAVVFSVSTTAVYDGESSHRSLDMSSPQGCWSGGLEEELPLDSSSVHEDEPPPAAGEERFRSPAVAADVQPEGCAADRTPPTGDHEGEACLPAAVQMTSKDSGRCSHRTRTAADPNFQILKLPLEGVLASGATAAGRISSPASPYYYNYLSLQTTHERMSVLSPSLDELSSRDEMFSTDLDEVDLFPKHVYAGRSFAETVGEPPADADEAWLPGSTRFMCACCGKNMAKGSSRSKGLQAKKYRDEAADSEDERYGQGCEPQLRVVVRKHSGPRKSYAAPPRHGGKPWYKRPPYQDPPDPAAQEDARQASEQEADGEVAPPAGEELQCGSCQDGSRRDDVMVPDPRRWADGELVPRRRHAAPLPRADAGAPRVYSRSREEDDAADLARWDRASKPREPRC
ncbi:bucky ball [Neosynchiropus ocellatus]